MEMLSGEARGLQMGALGGEVPGSLILHGPLDKVLACLPLSLSVSQSVCLSLFLSVCLTHILMHTFSPPLVSGEYKSGFNLRPLWLLSPVPAVSPTWSPFPSFHSSSPGSPSRVVRPCPALWCLIVLTCLLGASMAVKHFDVWKTYQDVFPLLWCGLESTMPGCPALPADSPQRHV